MLGLGTWGFGGPVALVGYMYRDLVEKRSWISDSDYKEGMALAQLGRLNEAIPDLQAAVAGGATEPEVAAALAFALAQTGRREEAIQVLRAAVARHPESADLATMLAQLEDRIPGQ